MNADQFATFIKMQEALVQKLVVLSANAGAASSATQVRDTSFNTTLVPNFECFDSAKETYKNYMQRFSNYITMKGIAENKDYCAKLLLNSIGAKYFNMATALAAPKAATDLTYKELLQLLENHLAPKKNVLVQQHKFLSIYQSEGQTVAEFVAALRSDINGCEFVSPCDCQTSIADVFLRAQFIRGIRENNIREQLLQSSTSKFEEIVDKAMALEAAKTDARELSQAAASNSNNNAMEINKIFNNNKKSKKPLSSNNGNKIGN